MPVERVGELHVAVGPMASGKTTYVIDELVKHALVTGEKVLLINHSRDIRGTKYSTHCNSRDASGFELIDFISLKSLSEALPSILSDYRVIGIDEGQFFDDLYNYVDLWVNNYGKTIYVSGLDGTSDMKIFGQICTLVPIADTFVKLRAICKPCIVEGARSYVEAPFTKYTGSAVKSQDVKVGGLDIYQPTCRQHHGLIRKPGTVIEINV